MRDQHLAGCLEPTRKQLEEVINNSNTCDAMEQSPSSHTYPASSSTHPLSSNPFPIFPPHTHEITSRCKHLFCPKCNNNTDTTKIAIKDELGERKAKEKKRQRNARGVSNQSTPLSATMEGFARLFFFPLHREWSGQSRLLRRFSCSRWLTCRQQMARELI